MPGAGRALAPILACALVLGGCAGARPPAPPPALGPAARCEPGDPVSAVVTGQVGAGVSDEGFVTERDIDLVIGLRPAGAACR